MTRTSTTYAIEPDAHVWEWIWHQFKSTHERREAQDEAICIALRQIDSWGADSRSHISHVRIPND